MVKLKKISKNSKIYRYLKTADPILFRIMKEVGEIQYICNEDPFESLIESIINQMLSNKASAKISDRFINLCDNKVVPKQVASLSLDEIHSIGISSKKAMYIKELADKLLVEPDYFLHLDQLNDAEIVKRLTSINGIGKWTADMFLIFVMDRPDILPVEDVAFYNSVCDAYNLDKPSQNEIQQLCSQWKPYSSTGARYLYRAHNMGILTKQRNQKNEKSRT